MRISPSWRRHVVMLLVVVAGAASPASAQNPTFSVEGVVTDAQQAVLPGAAFTIQNLSTGLTHRHH